jgi:hypothetical protein
MTTPRSYGSRAAMSVAVALGSTCFVLPSGAQPIPYAPTALSAATGCSPAERQQALRDMQDEVLAAAPNELESFAAAIEPGGPLAGWRLSHGYAALATAGAVATDNLEAPPPLPPLLLYEPSPSSTAADWLDFDGPDDPYRLVGWAYVAPYMPGSQPPSRRCIAAAEWLVHEAGWHLQDGGMQLTPGALEEPPRPPGLAIHMWHPRVWDLHVWRSDDGVPTVSFANPRERPGGKVLPRDAFFYLVDGEPRVPATR